MINKILVAIDLSENSEMALNRAHLLAQKWSSELYILHVVKKSFFGDILVNQIQSDTNDLTLENKAEQIILEKIKLLPKRKLTVKHHVVSGNSADKILEFIKIKNIDILVMGTHGDYFIHDWFLGSTAENVIRQCTCPILIVKNKVKKHYHRVIAAIDFTETSKNVLKYCSEMIPEANYTILHVEDPWYTETLFSQDISQDKMQNLYEEVKLTLMNNMNKYTKTCILPRNYKSVVKLGYPTKIVSEMADDLNSDLVVIGAKGKSNLNYAIIGSIANRILHEVNVDILMIPPRAQTRRS